ncbi:MAG: InlB B-repeat-containing protein [Treponema sp.]|nr:InlB B-repeat-containing protein [Treponema sp.]
MKKHIFIATLTASLLMALALCACSNSSDGGSTPGQTPATATAKYTVTIAGEIANGKVTASASKAEAGTEITLTTTPNTGYKLSQILVCGEDASGIAAPDGKFEMPAQNVIVTALFTAQNYTVTFNANNGSETPATATRTFTAGESKDLPWIYELGEGFTKKVGETYWYFVGWSKSPDTKSEDCEWGDCSTYIGFEDTILYAVWYEDPVHSIGISKSGQGTVSSDVVGADEGADITLTIKPDEGYEFKTVSANKVGANGEIGDQITVTKESDYTWKFTMPATHVKVNVTFNAIGYTIKINTIYRGKVLCECETATVGQKVALTAWPESGWALDSITVNKEGSIDLIAVNKNNNKWEFEMPAGNVNVLADFYDTNNWASGGYDELASGEDGTVGTSGRYVTFGRWPQTVKAENVTVNEKITQIHGDFTYCKGDDGAWYVKAKEYAFIEPYDMHQTPRVKYSDGSLAGTKGKSEKWFKVELIKWRVITDNYSGKKLLFAENAIAARRYNGSETSYINSEIRAWLNDAFVQSAFVGGQLSKIAPVAIDNETTTVKAFLLSSYEIQKSEYGFSNNTVIDSARKRKTTDYTRAGGATARTEFAAYWWLRNLVEYSTVPMVCGEEGTLTFATPDNTECVVPALCVSK